MKDLLLALAIVGFGGVWAIGVGYLRYRFERAYDSYDAPWFLAIWAWPIAWVIVAPFFIAHKLIDVGAWLARKKSDELPKAKVHR